MANNQSKKTKNTSVKPARLTAHGLLGSLSYWGSAARLLLTGILVGFAFLLNISGGLEASRFDLEIIFLLYGVGVLFVLDVGYVMTARALPLNKVFDRWVVMMSDLLVASFFVIPSLVVTSMHAARMRVLCLVAVLLLLSLRILLGLVLSTRKTGKRK